MKAIVYVSASGFTKKYAELLSSKTGLEAFELKKALKSLEAESEIVYMGWLMAGKVKGLKKAMKKFSVKAVCAVGMSSPGVQPPNTIKKQNEIDVNVFYLQGGFDITKLHGLNKFMMNTMKRTVGASLEKKAEKTAEEEAMLDCFKNGGDFVNEDNLSEIIDFLK